MSSGMQFVIAKLFTKEDPLYIHKVFGLLALISFAYRYFYVQPLKGNLGFEGNWFDWLTMLVHFILSSSSLIFHVLQKRILSKPMIIWHEYRLHAISFTLRCVSVFVYGYLRAYHHETLGRLFGLKTLKGSDIDVVLSYFVVMAHHVLADWITATYGDHNQTTVRVDNTSTPWAKAVLRFYSFYQFSAIASHLTPSDSMMDLGFNTLIAIQSSAFLMTLFRKGLIAYYSHATWYTFALVLSFYSMKVSFGPFAGLIFGKALAAFIIRMASPSWVSKYAIWAGFSFFSLPSVERFVSTYYNTLVKQSTVDELTLATETNGSTLTTAGAIVLLVAIYYGFTKRVEADMGKVKRAQKTPAATAAPKAAAAEVVAEKQEDSIKSE